TMFAFPPPVSRERIIREFPKCYTPVSSLQLKKDWDIQAKSVCKDRAISTLKAGRTENVKGVFDRDYKATIGVDLEIERFEISRVPFSLQIWDIAGQEKFKCIASAYYRGAQVIVTVFDMADTHSLDLTCQWLAEAMRENEPDSCFIFLVGTKSDLCFIPYPLEERERTEKDAIGIATEINCIEMLIFIFLGENIQGFFFRVAALAFEKCILKDMENGVPAIIGHDDSISM
uniref:Uncharacterized protein n=1 Tax=Mola mola TaxID=94237 RepID=A0A3Q3XB60_MOLML